MYLYIHIHFIFWKYGIRSNFAASTIPIVIDWPVMRVNLWYIHSSHGRWNQQNCRFGYDVNLILQDWSLIILFTKQHSITYIFSYSAPLCWTRGASQYKMPYYLYIISNYENNITSRPLYPYNGNPLLERPFLYWDRPQEMSDIWVFERRIRYEYSHVIQWY